MALAIRPSLTLKVLTPAALASSTAEGTISESDLGLFHVTDSAEDAVRYLEECHRYGRRGTVKPD